MDLWNANGTVTHHPYDPPFYLYLQDPYAYGDMIDALGERYRVEACTFTTLFGPLEGYSVHAGRIVAEAIEQQTEYEARLFNVDVRRDQRFMAEQGIVPCCDAGNMGSMPAACGRVRTRLAGA